MHLPGLHTTTPGKVLKCAVSQFVRHDLLTHVRAVTYQVLFSFFPFIIFLMALLGFLDLSDLFDWLRRRTEVFFLAQTAQQVNLIMDQLQQRREGMLSFGVAFSIWASSSAMRSLMKALNVVYGVQERRPLWKRYAGSILATLVVGLCMSAAVTLLLVRPQAMQVLAQYMGLRPVFAILWSWWLRWPAIFLLLTLTVVVIYWAAPDVEQRFRFVTPGACVAVLAWAAASFSFDFYVRNIAEYDRLYGNVGTAVALLLYVFISTFILLFGAELNAAAEHLAPTGKNDGEKTAH
ncbi:membrane protein [Noviherbaspirillum suwonense]|jgi:membrane protein|uniref:Membrane protein n=1 Tax=Noviherbaspirillum suwonense TaxID=1224511 RepID=A0ABY1PZ89_9BURK|nr:membrane protein [Noviherbaspirillum suwonense]